MAFPFIVTMQATLTGGGTGTLTYNVPKGENFSFNELFFTSTGAFSITDIRNARGLSYTNALGNNSIPSTFLQNPANEFNTLMRLAFELMLDGNDTIYIDVVDTSAAGNTVQCILNGKKERVGN